MVTSWVENSLIMPIIVKPKRHIEGNVVGDLNRK